MLSFLHRKPAPSEVEQLASVLVDRPASSVNEVFRRCRAADALAAIGPVAAPAAPALLRTLVVPVCVDCGLVLRVSAAAALWKVNHEWSVGISFLAWALKDEYWGVAPRAVEILAEIGHAAVVPDLIRLAERRLAHGPLYFEELPRATSEADSRPLLAVVADALGVCGSGRWHGPSYQSEARTVLTKLTVFEDERVRDAAIRALGLLDEFLQQGLGAQSTFDNE